MVYRPPDLLKAHPESGSVPQAVKLKLLREVAPPPDKDKDKPKEPPADKAKGADQKQDAAREGEFASLELLKEQPQQYRRYLRMSEWMDRMLPVLESEAIAGDNAQKIKDQLTAILDRENDGKKREK